MKKAIYIIMTVLAAILSFSCQKLTVSPTDKFTDASYWISASKAKLVLNMAYNQMYSAGDMWQDEQLSDNLVHTYGTSDPFTIRRGEATPALGLFANEWRDDYGGIKTCLVFLSNIDRIQDIDEASKNRMIDEIRFIRAFIYFRLVNYYGDVPFFTDEITLDDAYNIKRTPKAEIMTFIHSELDDIIKAGHLPVSDDLSEDERGRITLGAAVAFQARAYLYENNYQKVKDLTLKMITDQQTYGHYSLFTYGADKAMSYFMLFTPEQEYNSEVILDMTYVPVLKTWSNMKAMAPISKKAEISADNPTQELVDCYMTMNGLPVKGADKDPSYKESDPYVNRDPRLYATIVYDNYKWLNKDGSVDIIRTAKGSGTDDSYISPVDRQTKTGYYVHKYFDWTMSDNYESGLNIIMFRYADVLLMYAEACNELGKINESEWNQSIRPIRERAGFTAAKALDYPAGKNQSELRADIRKERRVELAMEGLRWFDIKRWKIGQDVLNGYLHGFKFAGSDQNVDGGYIRVAQYQFSDARDYLWSVPLDQMDLNQNLKPNNPGY